VRPFHDLRHTALTNEAASGSNPIAIMANAGHSDMKVTRRYLHLAGTVFRDEAEAHERRLLGEPVTVPINVGGVWSGTERRQARQRRAEEQARRARLTTESEATPEARPPLHPLPRD
jgi:hypothetical protein